MPDPTPDPLQDVPHAIRARLAAVTARLPPSWTLVEVIHDHYGWTARRVAWKPASIVDGTAGLFDGGCVCPSSAGGIGSIVAGFT